MSGLSPVQIFTLRFIVAYLLLLGWDWARKSVSSPQSVQGDDKDSFHLFCNNWKDELLMIGLGVTGGSAYFYTENEALRFSTATNVSLIVCSCPLVTTLLFRFVFKELHLSMTLKVGAVLAFVGMAVVVLNGQFVLLLSPLGDTLAFCACLSWAVYSILMKYVTGHYDSVFITRKVFFYGLLTILPYYIIVPDFPSVHELLQPEVFGNLLFLAVIASLVCFVAWNWALHHLGSIRVTNYVYVNPVSTILFASWILNEPITPYFIIGTFLILLGLYLSNLNKSQV